MSEPLTFWHGTRAPFRRGGYLFPRCQHGAEGTTAPVHEGKASPVESGDWVYVTTSKTLAWVYAWHAAGKGAPRILKVQPIGTLESDPEHSPAMEAYRCEMAKVLAFDMEPEITEQEAREGWVA